MNKIETQTWTYVAGIPEHAAVTATDLSWDLAGRYYEGKRISDRRVELYLNAIIDLYEDGLIQRTDDERYFGLKDEHHALIKASRGSWLDDRTDAQKAHDAANIRLGRKMERAEIIEYLEDYAKLVRQGEAQISLEEVIDNIESGLEFIEGVRQC
jgi:hypothetical protein